MKILTCTNPADDLLEEYRAGSSEDRWELVISGYWSESPCHSGHASYFVQRTSAGTWVLDFVKRNAELDGVTNEDVRKGRLNDDQIQAMWGMTLEEAQNQRSERIVAVWLDAPAGIASREAAAQLYQTWIDGPGMEIDESDGDGLLDGAPDDAQPAFLGRRMPKLKAKRGSPPAKGRKRP